jgi:hypothetical protein
MENIVTYIALLGLGLALICWFSEGKDPDE